METLPLHTPNVKPFTIYALRDPRDGLIRYVGLTDDIYRRFKEHIKGDSKNPAKNAWTQELRAQQEMIIMEPLARAGTYEEARLLEEKWIKRLLAEGLPLFNIYSVEPPPTKEPIRTGKLAFYDGKKRHHTASQIDEILDYYLLTGELPMYVSERQRRDYRHHPRLEDRRKLLQMAGELPNTAQTTNKREE